MNTRLIFLFSTTIFFAWTSAEAQGTFQNLDFEDANIAPIVGSPFYPYGLTTANALPGWSVQYNNISQPVILYNDPSTGGTAATLIANGYPTFTTLKPIDGNFSVLLFAGEFENEPAAATISQTGQIPIGTQSLLFDVALGSGPFVPEASIGSDLLTLFPIATGTGENGMGYTTWGANISAWAGQTEQLSFSSPAGSGGLEFDDISFSPNPIAVTPEPDPILLMGIGGALFAAYRCFAAKRR